MAEEKPAAKGTIATVVATAAVTLAIGITAAAFGGYLVPGGTTNEKKTTEVTKPTLAEARAAAQPSAPKVVLVPVAPDSPSAPSISLPAHPAGEVLLAAYEPTGHHDGDDDDDHRGRKHRERQHEDVDDDHHDED